MSNELKKMDNSMLPISESAPANIVYQQGEKNVHIDHADSVQQNVQMVFMGFSAAADGTMQPTYKTINREYYNLFVVGDELTPNEPFVLTPDRVLPAYWTEENVRAEYGSLSAEAIEKIKTFPSLFMAETRKYRAQAEDNEQVFFGFVTDVRLQGNGFRIRWEAKWPIPMPQIAQIGYDLGMLSMDCAITEMNRTHWSVKHVNLYDELKLAHISLMGM